MRKRQKRTKKDEEKPLDVAELLAKTTASMRGEFENLLQLPHFGEAGQAIADALRLVLAHHLPPRFVMRSGFVVGSNGEVSNQSDLLVTDGPNCPTFLHAPGAGIFPVDGILAGIEVTTSLDSKKWATDTLKIKKLRALIPAAQFAGVTPSPVGLLFAVDSKPPLKKVGDWLADSLRSVEGDHDRQWLPCGVVVFKKGIVCYRDGDRISFNPKNAAAVTFIESADTLAIFLHLLTYELRNVLERRRKCTAYQALLNDQEYGPILKSAGLPTFDTDYHVVHAALSLAAVIDADFPDFSWYFNHALQERLLAQAAIIDL